MKPTAPNESARFYFAFPRLLNRARGGGSSRSENNYPEAYLPGVLIFFISYAWMAWHLFERLAPWIVALLLIPLLFAVWIGWLVIFYLNSLVGKLCRTFGLAAELPPRRVQSVLIGILTTIFAGSLLSATCWLRWIGLVWLALLALNLGAAFVLALLYDERS